MEKLPIFISYKREDQPHAEELWRILSKWGHEPWLDVKDIRPGISPESRTWVDAIDNGLRECQVLIGLITPESLKSQNVMNEWLWAESANRRILLVRLKPFSPEAMSHKFIATDYVDFYENKHAGQQRLQQELTQVTQDRADFREAMTPPPGPPLPLLPDYLRDIENPKRYVPWRLTLRALGGLGVGVAFIWLIVAPEFEPLLALLGALSAFIASFVGENTPDTDLSSKSKLTDYEQMRKRVYQYWVQGVMETALKEVESVGIGLNMQPEAVVRDRGRKVGDIGLPNDSRHVRQVYDTFKSFLILGDPGAGKTIMLLQLAKSLILAPPPTHKTAIPLVLNLSSWSLDPKPIQDWLEDETWRTYRVRGSRVRDWLKNNQLILLLDGLDEVKEEVRADCVAAINTFHGAYTYVPMIVCSRIKDYERLGDDVRLDLAGAILLEDLSMEQVTRYLSDPQLAHLKRVIDEDSILREMTTTPFLLNTMIYAYRHEPEDALRGYETEAERREHLFTTYVQRRLVDNPSPYGYQQTLHYLEWLATKMQAYVQTVLHLEDIQAIWLADAKTLRFMNRLRLVRWLRIWQRDNLPLRPQRFLHAMIDRQIMRQMGGGYIFIHRYLLENFAGIDEVFVLIEEFAKDNEETRNFAKESLLKIGLPALRPIDEALRDVFPPDPAKRNELLITRDTIQMRPGVGVKDGLPDFDWVHIPAGEFIYQRGKVTLDYDFQISRYPVTYAQFQCFLDADDGYGDERWFAGLAADDSDKQMRDQSFKYANHPRENVNWYQAIAFCRWLSHKLEALTPNPSPSGRGAYDPMNPATWLVRLPTEMEWERATRGTDGREYPWGEGYKVGYANINETSSFNAVEGGKYNLGQTTAVGLYPQGASPEGLLDAIGNVWEWCLTDYDNPHEQVTDEDIRSNTRRVVRGGSFDSLQHNARAARRYRFYPNLRYYDLGLRVLRRPPSS